MEGLPTETLILPLVSLNIAQFPINSPPLAPKYLTTPKPSVTLSLTKKGREHKEAVTAAIKKVLDSYTSAYAFTFENMCNQRFKEFCEQHKSGSRFFIGSNKVMQISLGQSVGDIGQLYKSDTARGRCRWLRELGLGKGGLQMAPEEALQEILQKYDSQCKSSVDKHWFCFFLQVG